MIRYEWAFGIILCHLTPFLIQIWATNIPIFFPAQYESRTGSPFGLITKGPFYRHSDGGVEQDCRSWQQEQVRDPLPAVICSPRHHVRSSSFSSFNSHFLRRFFFFHFPPAAKSSTDWKSLNFTKILSLVCCSSIMHRTLAFVDLGMLRQYRQNDKRLSIIPSSLTGPWPFSIPNAASLPLGNRL